MASDLLWKADSSSDEEEDSSSASASTSKPSLLFLGGDDGDSDSAEKAPSTETQDGDDNASVPDEKERKVLIKNLAFSVTDKELEDFCSASGAVQNAFIVKDKRFVRWILGQQTLGL